MISNEFEWDDEKALSNLAKHGVSFEQARRTFRDPFALEFLDTRENYGEERYCLIGMIEERLLFVSFTPRDGGIRIISARGALPNERELYPKVT